MAVAALNGLELTISPDFEMGKTNKTPEYLAKFPLGKIPALETASGFMLYESSAITHYLCEVGPRREQLLGATPEERALVQQWVFFTTEQLYRTVMELVRPLLGFVPHDAAVEQRSREDLARWLAFLNEHLAGRTWFLPGGTALSLADISVAHGLRLGLKLCIDAEERGKYPNLMQWWDRVLAVPEVNTAFGGNEVLEKKPAA